MLVTKQPDIQTEKLWHILPTEGMTEPVLTFWLCTWLHPSATGWLDNLESVKSKLMWSEEDMFR